MSVLFYIDGGAGRVIAAIPALLKYNYLHPDEEWYVAISGWDNLVWGIPELQDRTFNPDTKGIFDSKFKHVTKIITPEPYRVPEYFLQKCSLLEAFDKEINQTNDHSDLPHPLIVLSKGEEKNAANIISDVVSSQKKSKTIVIQPFGRSMRKDRSDLIDDSSRSLDPSSYLKLLKRLCSKYNVILFAEPEFQLEKDLQSFKIPGPMDLRSWASVISRCDYFVGVDSVGQHMARAMNVPGTVIFGSTFPINTSYPDYFNIIEKPGIKKYSPIRICGLDNHLADRINDTLMDFSENEIDEMFAKIVEDIEKKVK